MIAATAVGLSVAAGTLLVGSGVAKADTPVGRIAHVYMNFYEPGHAVGQNAQDQWRTFIESIRNAAGHQINDLRTYVTQSEYVPHALIRADLNAINSIGEETTLQLWFTPNDLYLRGWTTEFGVTFYFGDSDFNLANEMEYFRRGSQDRGLLPPAIYQQLPYNGSYGNLSTAGAPDRGSQQYSYTSWWNAMYQLAWVQNPHVRGNRDYAASAASLQFMIQATSESVRLYDVWGTMAAMMLNQWTNYYMPTIQQQLENSWESLSNYVNSWATGGQPQPFDIPNVTRISTISQALRYLWTALAPFQSTGR